MITREKIQAVADKIAHEFEPEKIILFGSFAWGNPTEDSDVDLFVVKKSDKKRWEREYEIRRKIFPAGMPVDVLVYTPDELKKRLSVQDFFIKDILNKGTVLYG
ncbi:nucleotidyltransferase domain-containing protein [bacterium]|nr:nucleotidyltransferase domain-containing protein [bacterium]